MKNISKIDIMTKRWYVINTNEEVIIRHISFDWNEDKYTAEIDFINENPSTKALKICDARTKEDYMDITYIGHPIQYKSVWTATVNINKCLCTIPFGTKAAEVLFGEK